MQKLPIFDPTIRFGVTTMVICLCRVPLRDGIMSVFGKVFIVIATLAGLCFVANLVPIITRHDDRPVASTEPIAREAPPSGAPRSAPLPVVALPPAPHSVGEEFSIGYWTYLCNAARIMPAIATGQFDLKVPDGGAFVVIDITVRNNDKSSSTLPQFHLLDGQGNKYDASSKPMWEGRFFGPLEDLNPGVSKRGLVAFDVPPGRDYILQVSGGFESGKSSLVTLTESVNPTSERPPPTPPPPAALPPSVESQSGGTSTGTTSQPILLSKVEPEYSEEATRANFNGDVRVSIGIDESGNVESATVLDSPGLGLDEKVVAAVRQWRFQPARRRQGVPPLRGWRAWDGVPVPSRAVVTVTFARR
jgi:TonB family protein